MKIETFPDGSTIETNEATGDRTVCGKLAHDEYMRRLRVETGAAAPNIALKSGREVTHSPMANGATDASMADGGTMSETEWEEYCAILVKQNAARIAATA